MRVLLTEITNTELKKLHRVKISDESLLSSEALAYLITS